MIDAVNLGVAAIVLKDTASRQLLKSVRAVAAGTPALDRAAVQAALDRLQTRDDALRRASKELTRRELDIVRMVAVGARNKEIAEKLGISEGTVKMHLHTIYDKLRISGRVPLSIYARDHGVV
jgi:DNA-binding NarL/FixJ family response regulator